MGLQYFPPLTFCSHCLVCTYLQEGSYYKQLWLVRKGVSTTRLEMPLWFRAPRWWGMCSVSLCMCVCKNGLLPACFALLNIKVSDVPFKNSGLLGLAQEIKTKVLQSCLNSTVTSLKIGLHNYLMCVCPWQRSVNNVCLQRIKNTHTDQPSWNSFNIWVKYRAQWVSVYS